MVGKSIINLLYSFRIHSFSASGAARRKAAERPEGAISSKLDVDLDLIITLCYIQPNFKKKGLNNSMRNELIQPEKERPEEGMLSQNFKNLVRETVKILKSANPLEALQLASLENEEFFGLYEGFEKVLESTAELSLDDKLEILQLLKDEGMVGEEVYDLFAFAWMEMYQPSKAEISPNAEVVSVFEEKIENAVQIRDLVYEQAKNWVKAGLTEVPAKELEALRAEVAKIREIDQDVFNQFRGQLGSAILYRAEGRSKLDLAKALRLNEILFGKKQTDLVKVVYQAYKMVHEKMGFELRYRNEQDRPSFNPGTISLVRNTLDAWYDREKDNLPKVEAKKTEAVLYALDSFLIGISRRTNPSRSALLMGQRKMREGIRQVTEMDQLIKDNLMPKNLDDLIGFVEEEKKQVVAEMAVELSKVGGISFLESKPCLENLRFLSHRLDALNEETSRWEVLDEETLKQELTFSETKTNQLVKYIELEIKNLQGERTNLANMLDGNLSPRQEDKVQKAIQAVEWRIEELDKLRGSI